MTKQQRARTQKHGDAARKNGKLGGVKTVEGKAKSAGNAVTHALFATKYVPNWESPDEYARLVHDLFLHYNPRGPVEEHIVRQMAMTIRRTERLMMAERLAMERMASQEAKHGYLSPTGQICGEIKMADRLLFGRYDVMLTNQLSKHLRTLHDEQAKRRENTKRRVPAITGAENVTDRSQVAQVLRTKAPRKKR